MSDKGWGPEFDKIQTIIHDALEKEGYHVSVSDSGSFAKHPDDNNEFEVSQYPPAWYADEDGNEIPRDQDHPDFSKREE